MMLNPHKVKRSYFFLLLLIFPALGDVFAQTRNILPDRAFGGFVRPKTVKLDTCLKRLSPQS